MLYTPNEFDAAVIGSTNGLNLNQILHAVCPKVLQLDTEGDSEYRQAIDMMKALGAEEGYKRSRHIDEYERQNIISRNQPNIDFSYILGKLVTSGNTNRIINFTTKVISVNVDILSNTVSIVFENNITVKIHYKFVTIDNIGSYIREWNISCIIEKPIKDISIANASKIKAKYKRENVTNIAKRNYQVTNCIFRTNDGNVTIRIDFNEISRTLANVDNVKLFIDHIVLELATMLKKE